MENNIEEYLKSIIDDMVLDEKEEKLFCHYGAKKDEEFIYKTYYDIHRGVWTTYNRAVEGYVLSNLKPIIDKITK